MSASRSGTARAFVRTARVLTCTFARTLTHTLIPAAAVALSVSSCAWWEDIHIFSSAPKNKPTELTEIKSTLAVKSLWTANVGKAGKYFFTPALLGSEVIAAGGSGIVERRVLANGERVWRVDLDEKLAAGVGADANTIAVVGINGDLIALESSGRQRWKIPTTSEILSAPAVGEDLVVVRTTDSRVIAYDAATGKRRWAYSRTSQPLVLRSNPGMVIEQGLLIAGFPGGRLVALNLANGALRWESSVAVPKGATELERVADLVGTPVVVGREVCAAAFQGRAGCFDLSSGNAVWSRDVSTATGIEIDGRFAFLSDDKGFVHAFSRGSGASVWKADKLAYRRLTAPASVGRAVVVGDYKGFVQWLSREDGSLIARSTTDGTALFDAPRSFSAGSVPAVLFQTQDGNLYAFSTE